MSLRIAPVFAQVLQGDAVKRGKEVVHDKLISDCILELGAEVNSELVDLVSPACRVLC